ncbi:hypothetical protein E3N88_31104 [Mikania micrantha]|uniref:Uncharacterized protein n=1 Tax=Mikania micrantha TaxID=192012 RepID=A0A5N6MNP7_9ASTR|nr:hypothetical protein E3N88_31104 [Mikania micrantha]
MLPTVGLLLFVTCTTTLFNLFPTTATDLKTYIVYLSSPDHQTHETEEWYNSFLSKVASRSNEKPVMVHAYSHVVTGFAAKMTPDQAETMENLSGVLSVMPTGVLQLHTTRSPYFLGLRQDSGLWKDSSSGKGIIIGVIDSGIARGHPSFNDDNIPAPPSTWKGTCEGGGCNNKLIGIRNLINGSSSLDDEIGHGTHTSSTAAGNVVENANVFGLGNGTGSGMAPMAHLAMYKVCDPSGCGEADILAGVDAAIEDGVNVLSISLGRYSPARFDQDHLAVGTFAAMQKGIFGKVVLCDVDENYSNEEKGYAVKNAGGAAMIITNDNVTGSSISADLHVILASYVGYKEGVEIKKYLNSTSSPVAAILCGGTVVGLKTNPEMADFSSRGPNSISPGILKPDITGPGVNILAAWSYSIENRTDTNATYNVVRGTSMSCPHLAGIAALLKSKHPEWSPAAIKSALMTTAGQVNRNQDPILDERGLPADVLAMGSGHVNPQKALEPGLVFDIQPDDYIPYLCGLGYNQGQIEKIVKKKVSCAKKIEEAELNYPSFAVSLKRGESKTYARTVTNVGSPYSSYDIKDYSVPKGVSIKVGLRNDDQVLSFNTLQQKQTYEVTFSRDIEDKEKGPYGQGHMTWISDSGKYTVRTPFSFKFE